MQGVTSRNEKAAQPTEVFSQSLMKDKSVKELKVCDAALEKHHTFLEA